MSKRFLNIAFLSIIGSTLLLSAGCSQGATTKSAIGNGTSEETASKEPISSEDKKTSENNSVSESLSIKSDRNSAIWSSDEHDAAEKAATEFVTSLKNKDMEAISKQITYPITLTAVDGTDITFSTQKDFSSTAFDKIFDENFVSVISNSTELSSSWRGFMLGTGSNIVWFNPSGDGTMIINNIVTEHSKGTEDQSYAHK